MICTHWQRMTFDFLTFPDTCQQRDTPCNSPLEDQDHLSSKILIPLHFLFPCVPFPVLCILVWLCIQTILGYFWPIRVILESMCFYWLLYAELLSDR